MSNKNSKYNDTQLYEMLSGKRSEAEEAFAELYARHSQRVFAYCLRVTGHTEDAQDIFQETFLKFFDSAKEHDSIDNIPGYLLTIARNICINHKRDRKPNFTFEDFHTWTNESDYERNELLQLLATALELLEREYREAFVLRLYQGLSYPEIAKITGETVSAIKNRVWRAKEKLKEILVPYLEDLSK